MHFVFKRRKKTLIFKSLKDVSYSLVAGSFPIKSCYLIYTKVYKLNV